MSPRRLVWNTYSCTTESPPAPMDDKLNLDRETVAKAIADGFIPVRESLSGPPGPYPGYRQKWDPVKEERESRERLEVFEQCARDINQRLGRPADYCYDGGPVDWETGAPDEGEAW